MERCSSVRSARTAGHEAHADRGRDPRPDVQLQHRFRTGWLHSTWHGHTRCAAPTLPYGHSYCDKRTDCCSYRACLGDGTDYCVDPETDAGSASPGQTRWVCRQQAAPLPARILRSILCSSFRLSFSKALQVSAAFTLINVSMTVIVI